MPEGSEGRFEVRKIRTFSHQHWRKYKKKHFEFSEHHHCNLTPYNFSVVFFAKAVHGPAILNTWGYLQDPIPTVQKYGETVWDDSLFLDGRHKREASVVTGN